MNRRRDDGALLLVLFGALLLTLLAISQVRAL